MAYITLGNLNQLQLEIPTEGTKNWGTNLKDNFVIKLVEHDHSGNGKGAPLGISSFADNVINDVKIRLRHDQYLRSRNSTNTGDVNLIKTNASNDIIIGDATALQNTSISSATTTVKDLSVLNLKIPNNQYIKARNAADTDDIDIVKVNTSNVIEFAGSVTATPAVNSVGNTELQDNAISQSKMQDNSVGTNEIIDSNVTTTKIADGAITQAKRAALNISNSNISSSTFSSLAPTNIGSVSITTTGRPIFIGLFDNSTNFTTPSLGEDWGRFSVSVANAQVVFRFSTDVIPNNSSAISNIALRLAINPVSYPITSINSITTLPAGTHTIYLSCSISSGGNLNLPNFRLVAYEL